MTSTKVHHKYIDLSNKQTGYWKHTTVFQISSNRNRHQTLKHLRQYCCCGNRSVIGNRGGRWAFRNRGDIDLSPARRETTQANKSPKHFTKMGGGANISSAYFLYCHLRDSSQYQRRLCIVPPPTPRHCGTLSALFIHYMHQRGVKHRGSGLQ